MGTWLDKIKHIVVLMLENRSFDHMLGYLALPEANKAGDAVNGLSPGMSNPVDGVPVAVQHLTDPAVAGPDPDHSAQGVIEQLKDGNSGFAQSFARRGGDPGFVMGYYNGEELPAYDLLARAFCVCDHWFCSAPGPTWLNRLYALTGDLDPTYENMFENRSPLPIYERESFVRFLDRAGVSWRWYTHFLDVAPATLALVDREYRREWRDDRANRFRSVDVNFFWTRSFREDARDGELPALAWINPQLMVDHRLHLPTNDGHHPADVRQAQQLVRRVYEAVSTGKKWAETLLLITYDEHGGFYDHVQPPRPLAPPDEPDRFENYGPRVPALAISPWLEGGRVCSETFDHAPIIKTVMARFCPDLIGEATPRVRAANDLSVLPGVDAARTEVPTFFGAEAIEGAGRQLFDFEYEQVEATRGLGPEELRESLGIDPQLREVMDEINDRAPSPDVGPTQKEILEVVLDRYVPPPQPTELQEELLAAAHALRRASAETGRSV